MYEHKHLRNWRSTYGRIECPMLIEIGWFDIARAMNTNVHSNTNGISNHCWFVNQRVTVRTQYYRRAYSRSLTTRTHLTKQNRVPSLIVALTSLYHCLLWFRFVSLRFVSRKRIENYSRSNNHPFLYFSSSFLPLNCHFFCLSLRFLFFCFCYRHFFLFLFLLLRLFFRLLPLFLPPPLLLLPTRFLVFLFCSYPYLVARPPAGWLALQRLVSELDEAATRDRRIVPRLSTLIRRCSYCRFNVSYQSPRWNSNPSVGLIFFSLRPFSFFPGIYSRTVRTWIRNVGIIRAYDTCPENWRRIRRESHSS